MNKRRVLLTGISLSNVYCLLYIVLILWWKNQNVAKNAADEKIDR